MNDQEQKEKKGLIKEAMAAYDELENEMKLEEIIKDNKIEFKVGERTFRVRKPNLNEQDEIDNARRTKYTELINDDSYLFRKQWVKKYLDKGIDIKEMEHQMTVIRAEVQKVLLKMATQSAENILTDLKTQVREKRDALYALSIEITDLLAYCIETQTKIHVDSYTACVILEEKQEDEWVRFFKTYEEFQNSPELEVVNKTFYYFQYLMYSGE